MISIIIELLSIVVTKPNPASPSVHVSRARAAAGRKY